MNRILTAVVFGVAVVIVAAAGILTVALLTVIVGEAIR